MCWRLRIFALVLPVLSFSQNFESSGGLLFYKVSGFVLMNDGQGSAYQSKNVSESRVGFGGGLFYYKPVFTKSPGFSLGILSGLSLFSRKSENSENANTALYAYNQLRHDPSHAIAVQLPLIASLRLGVNATDLANTKVGIALNAGVTMSYFQYDNYYFDHCLYFPPTLGAEVAIMRLRFRLSYFLLPYKTYYKYDTGRKEKKYNISQFVLSLNYSIKND